LLLTVFGGQACGAKDVTARFTQSLEDCSAVAQWELHSALVGASDPVPADATVAGVITTPQGVCGQETLSALVSTTLPAGTTRFWLRTVATDGALSNFSNPIDADVPLNAPVLIEILFQ
jgi:hypothetical protein